ncbi:hypothetical protein [Prochlorococcus sp. MIT 0604]|uniref:hypothetical protein n=1 Tax=Prochlorococcus sp. MIT 0604 TaxID=1501268 RepID=UPI0004F7D265|nr:hypothetical protein [Prochlorococcus sp. MIT 0604]AIQ96012.1 hypothetical protein EW14_2005 [Prochlorococcus sp. MIT 0604]
MNQLVSQLVEKYKDLANKIIDEFDDHIKKGTVYIDDYPDFDEFFTILGILPNTLLKLLDQFEKDLRNEI